MMDRQKGDIVFECDICGDTLLSRTGNFEAARSLMRQNGWRAYKIPGEEEWRHKCDRCQRPGGKSIA